MPHIKAHHLKIVLRGRTIVENMCFDLDKGQGLILTGPNGAGKTVLLQALAGRMPLAEGTLAKVPDMGAPRYLPFAADFDNFLKVGEFLRSWGGSAWKREVACWGLEGFMGTKLARLSAGERKRLLLAAVLSHDARWYLMDEPTVGLESAYIEVLENRLNQELSASKIVILASHDEQCFRGSSWKVFDLSSGQQVSREVSEQEVKS